MKTVIHNPGGLSTTIAVEDDNLITGSSQDCTPVMEYAKARQREGAHGSSEMRLAASVPSVIVEKYINDNGITLHEFSADQAHQRRLLNDPALAYFRIWPGAV